MTRAASSPAVCAIRRACVQCCRVCDETASEPRWTRSARRHASSRRAGTAGRASWSRWDQRSATWLLGTRWLTPAARTRSWSLWARILWREYQNI